MNDSHQLELKRTIQVLRIKNWDRYVHPDCKRASGSMQADGKRIASQLPWVKCPTSHTGLGYLELMDHEDGTAHFGAWILILETAATCPERGLLLSDANRPIGARELSLKTRGKKDIFIVAIERLLAVGWLELIDVNMGKGNQDSALQVVRKTQTSREGEHREIIGETTTAAAYNSNIKSVNEHIGASKRITFHEFDIESVRLAIESGNLIAVVAAFGGNSAKNRETEWIRDSLNLQVGSVAAIFLEAIENHDPIREPSRFRIWRDKFMAWPTEDRKEAVQNLTNKICLNLKKDVS